jgi:hypothetical protein
VGSTFSKGTLPINHYLKFLQLGASRTIRRDDLGAFPGYIHTAAVDQQFLKIYDQEVEKNKNRKTPEPSSTYSHSHFFLILSANFRRGSHKKILGKVG